MMFEAERTSLIPYRRSFDGFHATSASVSKTCLIRFDRNRYSVMPRGGRVDRSTFMPMPTGSSSNRMASSSAHMRRRFGCDQIALRSPGTTCRCLARKPGALRNGAPFKDWLLPASLGAGPPQARRFATMVTGKW